ncbi:MAG: glycosyltransferase family 2 protein [Clostridia bacterium]|nr:glycosyltransferase family 2 protein [Clostridia bacterium]
MVGVLLAVYNGEKYLSEQIDSLLNQTADEIKIIIRDDGSTDSSANIIKKYVEKYPNKMQLVDGKPTGSASKNFAELLSACDDGFDYIMFCDQDDVWLPEKIENTLKAMKKAEGENSDKPVLVHTDLKVVDGSLNTICDSFFGFQKLIQDNITLPKLLVQNYVTGCTVMINRALKQKCGKIPNDCIMHDWWLALVAVIFGELVCLNEPTMLYRQHDNNQVGAKASYGIGYIKRKLATLDEVRKNYNATYNQAQSLLKCYKGLLNKDQIELIQKYCEMSKMGKLKKIKTIEKYGFKKGTKLRIFGQYILM